MSGLPAGAYIVQKPALFTAGRLPWRPSTILGLAVFRSEGRPICRRVAPAVEHVASDPLLAVSVFDETTDAEVWREATVPGSP